MKIFEFERQGIKFCFRNPRLNQYGKMVMEYKILGIKENKHNPEGYFYNSEFLPDKNVMSLYVEINGKNIRGVKLPENVSKELKNLLEHFRIERENNINQVVDELVTGKRNICFSIVGCDYPHYQAWVNNLQKDLDGLEQDIMKKAISKVLGQTIYSNPCEYLESILNRYIFTKDDMPDNIINPRHEQKTLEYYGYKDTVVTHFEMKLMSLMQPVLDKIQEKNEKVQRVFKKAKETGEKQLLVQWSEECNDPEESCNIDNCYKYAMPDGSIKTERYHTW